MLPIEICRPHCQWRPKTGTVTLAELLAVFGSCPLLLTLAVLLTLFGANSSTLTTSWIFPVAPFARVPSEQFNVPEAPAAGVLQLPCVSVALTNVTTEGNTSVTATSLTALGPPFIAVSVYVSWPPLFTGLGLAPTLMLTSALTIPLPLSAIVC
jgi:hypothetical protein